MVLLTPARGLKVPKGQRDLGRILMGFGTEPRGQVSVSEAQLLFLRVWRSWVPEELSTKFGH